MSIGEDRVMTSVAHLLMRASSDAHGVPSMAIPFWQWLELWVEMQKESEDDIPFCREDFPYRNVIVMGCEVFPIEDLRHDARRS